MVKEKKLYAVYEKVIQVNDFLDEMANNILVGYTYAISPEKAVSNVKHEKGIKKKNYYEYSNYLTNCLEKHKFYAEEVKNETNTY